MPFSYCNRYNSGCVRSLRTLAQQFRQRPIMRFTTNNSQSSSFSRAVGLLLVLFILYGTTVEAAHRHGRVLPSANNTASISEPGTTDTSFGSKSGCHDCLICQLHQNFNATLISVTPGTASLRTQLIARNLDSVSIRSGVNTPQSGRAPPQAN